jgi:glycosyltransferase involved in cell wall biosynthesis
VQNWTQELERRGETVEAHHSTSDEDGSTRLFELAQFARFLNRMRTGPRPSLLHVHIGSGRSFARKAAYLSVCHALGIPTIIHIHGVMHLIDFYERHARQRRIFASFLRRSSCVIMCSARNQAPIRQWTGGDVPIHTLYNAPSTFHRPINKRPAPGRITVAFLGLFIAPKGIWELLDAAEMVHNQVGNAHFIFAGDGPEFAALTRAVTRRQMTSYVSLPGWVTGEERLGIMEQTDVFCLPSHSEGFPVSIVEAMSMSTSIVASDVGGIPEAIIDGEHGLLVPPEDSAALAQALTTLLQDPSLRKQLGEAAKKRAEEKFSIETIIDELWTHWEAAVSNKGL